MNELHAGFNCQAFTSESGSISELNYMLISSSWLATALYSIWNEVGA